MDELEKLQQAILGMQSKIELIKNENSKVKNQINDLAIQHDLGMKELNRLKETGRQMQNSIDNKKQQVQEQNNQEFFNSFMDELGGVIK